MPIYEFYCPACHTVFNFFSKSINTTGQPACPKCARPKLDRQISQFAHIGNAGEENGMDDFPVDEAKMERAMETLAHEAEGMNEDDPRAAATLMRKMSELTGLKFGEGMEEAVSRMEAGEDPEQIEQEMGDLLDSNEDSIQFSGARNGGAGKHRPLQRDEKLYDM